MFFAMHGDAGASFEHFTSTIFVEFPNLDFASALECDVGLSPLLYPGGL